MKKELNTQNKEQLDTISNKWVGKYDENNNCIINKTFNTKNEIVSEYTNTYDQKGNCIESRSRSFLSSKEHISKRDFIYNAEKLIEKIFYNSYNGKVSGKIFYKYDINGNLIEELDYDYHFPYENDSILKSKRTLIYDNRNRLVEEKILEYDFDGRKLKLFKGEEYIYDSKGNKTRISTLNKKGKVTYEDVYEYEYNSVGLPLRRKTIGKKGKIYAVIEYKYTFF